MSARGRRRTQAATPPGGVDAAKALDRRLSTWIEPGDVDAARHRFANWVPRAMEREGARGPASVLEVLAGIAAPRRLAALESRGTYSGLPTVIRYAGYLPARDIDGLFDLDVSTSDHSDPTTSIERLN